MIYSIKFFVRCELLKPEVKSTWPKLHECLNIRCVWDTNSEKDDGFSIARFVILLPKAENGAMNRLGMRRPLWHKSINHVRAVPSVTTRQ